MARQADPEIPADESLFRRLRAAWVDGDRVLDDAIDMQGTSCDRESQRDPNDLVDQEWPQVGVVTSAMLPVDEKPAGQDLTWSFFVVDAPTESNDAHCEIRVRRSSRSSLENDPAIKKRPHALKLALKSALAARFRVLTLGA